MCRGLRGGGLCGDGIGVCRSGADGCRRDARPQGADHGRPRMRTGGPPCALHVWRPLPNPCGALKPEVDDDGMVRPRRLLPAEQRESSRGFRGLGGNYGLNTSAFDSDLAVRRDLAHDNPTGCCAWPELTGTEADAAEAAMLHERPDVDVVAVHVSDLMMSNSWPSFDKVIRDEGNVAGEPRCG